MLYTLSGFYREYGVTNKGGSANKHIIRELSKKYYIIQYKEYVEYHDVKIT